MENNTGPLIASIVSFGLISIFLLRFPNQFRKIMIKWRKTDIEGYKSIDDDWAIRLMKSKYYIYYIYLFGGYALCLTVFLIYRLIKVSS